MLVNIFKKPETLNKETHKEIRVSANTNYSFSKDAYLVPIGVEEMVTASKSLIVVFIKEQSGSIYPAVVLSGDEKENLLLTKDGNWKENCYIPAAIRAYPFGIGGDEKDKYIIIDTEANSVKGIDGERLFDEQLNNTKQGEYSFNFVNEVYTQIQRAKELGETLESYGLLRQANLEITKGEEKYTLQNGIYIIDENNLNKLESRKIKKLATKGALKFIYAHLFSLLNRY